MGKIGIGTTSPAAASRLHVAGEVHAAAFVPTSDRNLKTNIQDFSLGLETLKKIRTCNLSIQWKSQY